MISTELDPNLGWNAADSMVTSHLQHQTVEYPSRPRAPDLPNQSVREWSVFDAEVTLRNTSGKGGQQKILDWCDQTFIVLTRPD